MHQLVAAFEQLIAAELAHPAIAQPIATGITGATAYLAVDYVAAESLDLAVREYGPAPPLDALRVITQLAGGLDFVSVVSVVHGALHPRDVLLSADDTRVTGVGVARALEQIGVNVPVRRPYTAPERVAGGAWDRRADIFSLAALAHELLWGRRITGTGRSVADNLAELAGGDLNALRDVFAQALADDPGERFATALEFASALESALSVGEAAPAAAPAVALVPEPTATKLPLEPVAEVAPEPPPAEPLPEETPAVHAVEVDTLELRRAEEERYQDVESAPAIVEPPPPVLKPAVAPPLSIAAPRVHEAAAVEPRRRIGTALLAIAAALLVGLVVGYGVGQRAKPPQVVDEAPAAAPAAAPGARDATEVAVNENKAPLPESVPGTTVPGTSPGPAAGTAVKRSQAPPAERSRAPASRPAPARPERTPEATASGTAGRFVGRLAVDSRPDGARVFLDGRMVGTTPLEMPTVGAGEHAIRIERDGYRRWSSSVRVVATERTRVTASLER